MARRRDGASIATSVEASYLTFVRGDLSAWTWPASRPPSARSGDFVRRFRQTSGWATVTGAAAGARAGPGAGAFGSGSSSGSGGGGHGADGHGSIAPPNGGQASPAASFRMA